MTEHAAVGGIATTEYTTPAAGSPLPHAVVGTTTTVDGTVTDEATYSYDETGNMVTRPGQTLTWDAEGRLATNTWSSDDTETVTSHIYTADGSRLLRKNNDGSATLYLPGQEISVDEHGQIGCARYYTFAGSTFAVRTSSGLSWLFNDHQGTASMTQQAGSGTATYRYQDPYGGPRGLAAAWPSERGFVGGTNDPSGLTHLGAREYDPGLGVFISVDPVMDLTNPKQMHAYTYANANPTTFSDPTGLWTPERGGVPCIDGDCSFHNKNGSLKTKDQCAKNACGTNPLYDPSSSARPPLYLGNNWGDPTQCIDGDCTFHNKDYSIKDADQCARSACGTNSIYTVGPRWWVDEQNTRRAERAEAVAAAECGWWCQNADLIGIAAGVVVGLGCTVATGGAGALACGALGGAISGGLTSGLKGGSVGDVLGATLTGALIGGLSGGLGGIVGSAARGGLQKLGALGLKLGGKAAARVARTAAVSAVKDIAATFTRAGWRNMATNASLTPRIPAAILQTPSLIFNGANVGGAAIGGAVTGAVAGFFNDAFDFPGAAGGFVGGLFG